MTKPNISEVWGHDRYVHAWSNVLRSSKTSTLKFAVARAILDEARETPHDGELLIARQRLSLRLVSYYWYQVRQFRLKQAAAEIQEPNVARQLRSLGDNVDTKWDPLRPEIRGVLDFVTEYGFKEVLPRFHNGIEGRIFETRHSGTIAIPVEQLAFVKMFNALLIRSVQAGWAAQVEQYNVTPRVLAKVRFDGRRRTSVSKWAKPLREVDNACFYCRKPKPEPAHVDHVIPWSFLFDDPAWNLVLACDSCNSSKCDKIPAKRFLSRLHQRNSDESILAAANEFGRRLVFSLTQLPHPGPSGLEKSLDVLCQQAFLQGFTGDWAPS